MSGRDVKRHSTEKVAAVPGTEPSMDTGVGARPAQAGTAPRGGGYPGSCTILNFRPSAPGRGDPRLDELRRMGIPRVWLEIAEIIGVDHYLAMWRHLDRQPEFADRKRGVLQMDLRFYSSYLRFQRNRFIETLDAAGYSPKDIQQALRARLGETVTIRHIYRLVGKD